MRERGKFQREGEGRGSPLGLGGEPKMSKELGGGQRDACRGGEGGMLSGGTRTLWVGGGRIGEEAGRAQKG